jgi:hypothetical protein
MQRAGGELFANARVEKWRGEQVQLPVHRHHAHPQARVRHGQLSGWVMGTPELIRAPEQRQLADTSMRY